MYFEGKMKRKIKLNSEYLLSFATLKIKSNWRMKIFFLILPKTTKCEFNNFNIGTVNAI